jgi:radical SAM protein with 4Fe4S-binding SPASM domain
MDTYKKLIDEGVKNGLCSIKYNYLGEPTLNPQIVEMVEYAKQAGVLDVMFNTNATRLDEKLSRRLIASGLDKLFFSFDSPYREHYNRIRVKGDYDDVLGNIRRFMEIRDEMESVKPFTRVSMVLMKENQGEWEDFQKLFKPIVDAVAYVDYLDHGSQQNAEYTLIDIGSRQSKFCCPQLWQRMFVHPDGVVTVCCLDSNRELQVGNIFENSAQEIWLGEEYQRLRDLHANGRFDEIAACARCPLAHY